MMNLRYSVTAIIFGLIIFPLASVGGDPDHPYYGKNPGDPARGAVEWANNCTRCHNSRSPSELTDDIWHVAVNHMRVRAGLTGQQARDILAYLSSANFTPVVSERKVTRESSGLSGQQIYSGTCVACHGKDGKGAIPGVPKLSERLKKPDSVLIKHISEGFQSPGSSMAMPARGGNPDLSDNDIELVLNYLRQEFGK